MNTKDEQIKFNIFAFFSTFARSLIEIFISLYLFKNGYSVKEVLVFYFYVNVFSIPISYFFVKIGEKTKYVYIMIIGFLAFILVQLLLRSIQHSILYLMLTALLYSVYRRGYWVARRFYITKIMPEKKTSGLFSIVLVTSQISSIAAGYVGSYVLENSTMYILTLISSVILFLSIIPLFSIQYKTENKKIELSKNFEKCNKKNLLLFSLYELNNLLTFIFPIYVALYIENSYSLAGNINAINNLAIMLFVLIYGKIINKNKNYLFLSTTLVLICTILKINIVSYSILIVYFIEGLAMKMQNQSVNKVYFEERNDIDLTHYNLIYQITECFSRAMATVSLLFMDDIRKMMLLVICIMIGLFTIYLAFPKTKINTVQTLEKN